MNSHNIRGNRVVDHVQTSALATPFRKQFRTRTPRVWKHLYLAIGFVQQQLITLKLFVAPSFQSVDQYLLVVVSGANREGE